MPERATKASDPSHSILLGASFMGSRVGRLLILLAFVVCTPIISSIFVATVALSDHFIVVPALHLVYEGYENSSFHKSFLDFLEIFPLAMVAVHGLLIIKMLSFLEEQMITIFLNSSRDDHES